MISLHSFVLLITIIVIQCVMMIMNGNGAFFTTAAPTASPLINASQPFWQLNSTRMLFANETPLAGWPKTPINTVANSIIFDAYSKRYLILADNYETLFSASEDALRLNPQNAFFEHVNQSQKMRQIKREILFLKSKKTNNNKKKSSSNSIVNAIPIDFSWIGTQVDPSHCLSPVLTPAACSGSPSTQTPSTLYLSSKSLMHCYFKNPSNPTSFNCDSYGITGGFADNLAPFHNVAISSAPVAADKKQSVIMVSTTNGLYALYATGNGQQFRAEVITLKNTIGNNTVTSNVTWVGCLPPRYYSDKQQNNKKLILSSMIKSKKGFPFPNTVEFFDADCFATTDENYNKYGVEADLIHNIKARSSTDFGYVVPHRFERIPGIISGRPTATVYTPLSRRYYMGNVVSVSAMKHTGAYKLYNGFRGGLPTGSIQNGAWLDLTDAHQQMVNLGGTTQDYEKDGVVFFGTKRGAIAKIPSTDDEDAEEGKWKLLLGGRWLPGGNDGTLTKGMNVNNFASGSKSVLCSTDTGFSLIYAAVHTPMMKAQWYENVIAPKHQRTDGLFADNRLTQWGNAATSTPYGTANDGLWSSMRAVSECLRYVASGKKDLTAKANAWKAFSGLQLLVNVTGVKGLMARSAWKGEKPPGNQWIASTAMPGWWLYPGASSDEVTGHFAGSVTLHDLCSDTPAEKAQAAAHAIDIMSHIVDGGLTLIGIDGKPTHWGHWEPADLNDNPFWYDDRGPNSIQILGWLSACYRISGNQTYADVFNNLVEVHGYGRNLINAKITEPNDDNFSDDELMMMAYLTLALSGKNLEFDPTKPNPLFLSVAQEAEESIYRHWIFIKRGKPSLWGALYCIFQPIFDVNHINDKRHKKAKEAAIEAIWYSTVNTPIDLVDWPVDNGQRLNAVWNPHDARNGQAHVVLENLFPFDEQSQPHWNGNVFTARQGSGNDEASPVTYTFPFYAALAAPYLTGNNI